MLTLSKAYSDNMVLQRRKRILLQGYSEKGNTITVTFKGTKFTTTAGDMGYFLLSLPQTEAGGPYELTISDGKDEKTFERIYVGEVFIAAGQSNMEFSLEESLGGVEELNKITGEERIHFFKTDLTGKWILPTKETAKSISAISWYFAKKYLEGEPDLHIGMLGIYKGASSASGWVSKEELESFEEGRKCISAFDELSCVYKTEKEYLAAVKKHQIEQKEWQKRFDELTEKHPELPKAERIKQVGDYPWQPPYGPKSFMCPTTLYYNEAKPIFPYTARAVLYYQGEQDMEYRLGYENLLSHLITFWRRELKDNLPFLLVQLPMWDDPSESWPYVREAQMKVSKDLPEVYIVPMTDAGEKDNIHPIDKKTPALRLEKLAENLFKGKKNLLFPEFSRTAIYGNDVVISFKNAKGLHAEGKLPVEVSIDGKTFQEAHCRILNDQLYASFQDDKPILHIRYAFHNWAPGCLMNEEGNPCFPFRTDNL